MIGQPRCALSSPRTATAPSFHRRHSADVVRTRRRPQVLIVLIVRHSAQRCSLSARHIPPAHMQLSQSSPSSTRADLSQPNGSHIKNLKRFQQPAMRTPKYFPSYSGRCLKLLMDIRPKGTRIQSQPSTSPGRTLTGIHCSSQKKGLRSNEWRA